LVIILEKREQEKTVPDVLCAHFEATLRWPVFMVGSILRFGKAGVIDAGSICCGGPRDEHEADE
jgi:hypothetical protein